MPLLRAQVVLKAQSAMPRDHVVNVWHFWSSATDSAGVGAAAQEVATELIPFYNAVPSGGSVTLASFLSNTVALNGHEVRVYNMSDEEPRPPRHVASFNLASKGADTLPREVALCLSFQGAAIPGEKQARRRGRVFLGPFSAAAGTAVSSTGRPHADLISTVRVAAAALLARTIDDPYWCVFSPTKAGVAIPDVSTVAQVQSGWVDDEWDTVRARGMRAVTRQAF
jgi:hypothetical protein